MKKIMVIGFMLMSVFISCNSGGDDCDKYVSVDKIGETFVKIKWGHSCMSCEKWEIKYDFDCFFCWFPKSLQVNTGGNAFQGYDHVITGLKPNKNYKATVFSVGSPVSGQPCVREKIGRVYFKTN